MSLTPILSAAQIAKIRRLHYAANQYLSLCGNVVIFAAQIDQATFEDAFATVDYDNVTAGAFGDIVEGMTIYFSSSNSIDDWYWRGRVRADDAGSVAGATTVNINETSSGDVADDDYIFVVNDYALHEKLARDVAGTHYKDYDHTYDVDPPVIGGIQSAYAGWCDAPTGGTYTVAFSASAITPVSGRTISSYLYAIPAGGGVVSAGALNTANVTIDFNPSADGWWMTLTVTDDGGDATVFHFIVFAHDDDNPPALGFTGADLEATADEGWSGSVEAFDGVDDVLDNTLAVVWSNEWHGTPSDDSDIKSSILSTVNHVGRLRIERDTRRGDPAYSYITGVRFDIEGAFEQLQRTAAQLITMRDIASPDEWDEINDLTVYREIVHFLHQHSTFLELHSFTVESTGGADDDTFQELIKTTQSGQVLATIQELASGINARLEMDAQGRSRLSRDARYLTTAQRAALNTIEDFDERDWSDLDLEHDPALLIGRVDASGSCYDTAAGGVDPYLSRAPGEAQGPGEGESGLHKQLLQSDATAVNAQAELNNRAGHHYAAANPYDRLTVTPPSGAYHLLSPSRAQWFTWTIAAADTKRGRAYTTDDRWLLESMRVSHDNRAGTKDVELVFGIETTGAPGQTVPMSIAGEISLPHPMVPPFDPYPSFPEDPFWEVPGAGDADQPPYSGVNPGNPAQGSEWIPPSGHFLEPVSMGKWVVGTSAAAGWDEFGTMHAGRDYEIVGAYYTVVKTGAGTLKRMHPNSSGCVGCNGIWTNTSDSITTGERLSIVTLNHGLSDAQIANIIGLADVPRQTLGTNIQAAPAPAIWTGWQYGPNLAGAWSIFIRLVGYN